VHLNDFRKTEEATGVIDLPFGEGGFGCGRSGFTSLGVGSGVLEDSELLLREWLIADIGIG
jgi:hypothetical protein